MQWTFILKLYLIHEITFNIKFKVKNYSLAICDILNCIFDLNFVSDFSFIATSYILLLIVYALQIYFLNAPYEKVFGSLCNSDRFNQII